MKNTKLMEYDFDSLLSLAEEIKRMLIASLNTAKESAKLMNGLSGEAKAADSD